MLSFIASVTPTSSEQSWEPVTYSLRVDFTDSKDPQPPPLPPAHKKNLCRISSDTPQFLIKTSWAKNILISPSQFELQTFRVVGVLRTQDLTPFLDFLSTNGLSTASCCIIDQFTVMSLVP